ncbi:MAG TPA: IPT/TIG domain-containing protein [Gaiellales bacterium]|nr:IPT/TIG domain-containing protein [Gaiellales bacterium]
MRAGRPLTWALKDLSIDLHVFVEVDGGGRVLMRSAGANEEGASVVHLSLAAITRPMVEENTLSLRDETDPRTIDELRGHMDDDDRRRLDMVGIRTVGQLRRLTSETTPAAVEATIGLPVDRLRALLEQAARPAVTGHEVLRRDGGPLLRIQGVNLSDGGSIPEVRLAGELVEVLEVKPQQLVVRPRGNQDEGPIEVRVGGDRATGWFRIAGGNRNGNVNGNGNGHTPAPEVA